MSLAAALPIVIACGGDESDTGSPLPATIHGMQLQATHQGEEAAQILESLHGRPVGSEQSWVGIYGPMNMATAVYVSRFTSPVDAQTEMDAMVARIDSGTVAFGHHTSFAQGDRVVHSAFGQGQVNYFYKQDADLWWLGAHPMIARPAIAELLGIPTDSVPRLGPAAPPPMPEPTNQ
jgi:hypothetical protein